MSDPHHHIDFRTLHDSPLLRILDFHCHAGAEGPAAEEQSNSNNIVLMRQGAFRKHFGRRSVTADVNQAIFFSKDSVYQVSHPGDCGDRGTTFSLPQRILNDLVRELRPAVDEDPEHPFPFAIGPCPASLFWRHRELVRRLESAETQPLESLWAEVTALQLMADVLEAAFDRYGLPRPRRREATEADHAERAEAAKNYLASRLDQRVTLEEVAEAVHVSPFHLARLFQQRTGLPIHRYLTQLRLRASLERLADGPEDLATLALDLGFSAHSHFAEAFRKEFGLTPSEARRTLNRSRLRELGQIQLGPLAPP